MPFYEYSCKECGSKFELFVRSFSGNDARCTSCKSRKVRKLFSTFGVISRGKSESAAGTSSGHSCGRCSRSSCAGCTS